MDYETFGEHQWAETGILEFMRDLPRQVLARPGVGFATPSEIATTAAAADELAIPRPFSWADQERDLSAWLGNPMQRDAHRRLYELLPRVRSAVASGASDLLEVWRRLSTSDHVYYMSTKFAADGDVHEYFSPYDSPHDAYLHFVHVLDDLRQRLDAGAFLSRNQTERQARQR
jgi:alpha-amylase